MRVAIRKHIYLSPRDFAVVLAGRIHSLKCSDCRLAMLEMRLLIAYFMWYFDAELIEPEEPLYEDRFVARRGALQIRVRPVREMNIL